MKITHLSLPGAVGFSVATFVAGFIAWIATSNPYYFLGAGLIILVIRLVSLRK